MEHLEVSCAVRRLYKSLVVKGLSTSGTYVSLPRTGITLRRGHRRLYLLQRVLETVLYTHALHFPLYVVSRVQMKCDGTR